MKKKFFDINDSWLKFLKDISIKKKLPILLGVQIAIPLLLISFLSYIISTNIIEKKSIEYSHNLLNSIKFNITDYTNNIELISQDILYEKKIYDVLNNEQNGNYSLYIYEVADEIHNIFKRLIFTRNEIQAIALISNNRDYYISEKSSKNDNNLSANYNDILEKARESSGSAVWFLNKNGSKTSDIFLARLIYNQDTFREIGLLVIQLQQEYLERLCLELINNDIQDISIISGENINIVGNTAVDNSFFDTMKGNDGSFLDKSKKNLTTFSSMEKPDWILTTSVSFETLYAEIVLLRLWIILLSGVSVILVVLLSLLVSADFVKPINTLAAAMENVGDDGSIPGVDMQRKDEFGFLGRKFNYMAGEINHLVKWVYKERITRREAELKALQAQINPHFLFNTLESINWMARMHSIPEISQMVTSLSSLLDANIGRDNKLITISQEFQNIKNYIHIMEVRFNNRITFIEKLSPEVSNIKIPKLLIQPLVENAIYHGVEKKRGKGVILLRAKKDDDIVVIEIADNGGGIDEQTLIILRERLEIASDEAFNSDSDDKRKSIGIENVNRRLKLFYGDDFGLQIVSKYGFYTKFTAKISLSENLESDD